MVKYTQKTLNEALIYFRSNKKAVSARQVVLHFGIPVQTLRDNLKKTPDIITGMVESGRINTHKKLFTTTEEQILMKYALCAMHRAHPVTRNNLIQAAEALLSKENNPRAIHVAKSDHKGWFLGFRQRNPILTFMTPGNLSQARLNLSQVAIRQWFSSVRTFLAENGLLEILQDPSRMYNMSESGFLLSTDSKEVLEERGAKQCFEEASNNVKENITVLAAVSPSGLTPPPMIIYPGKTLSKKIQENAPEQHDHILAHSPKGYITFETLYEYIVNYFYNFLVKNKVQFPVVIFSDWHETRSNFFLAKQMNEMGIYLIGLPANSTQLLQPLDVLNFDLMKIRYNESLKKFNYQHPGLVIKQARFGQILMPIYYKSMSKENTLSGFHKCGLYPWDADAPDYSKITSLKGNREGMLDQKTQFEKIFSTDVETQTLPYHLMFPPVYGTGETMCDMMIDLKDLRPLKHQKQILAKELDSGTKLLLPHNYFASRQKDVVVVTESDDLDDLEMLATLKRRWSRASSRGTSPSRDPPQSHVLRALSPISTGSFDFEGFDPDEPPSFPEASTTSDLTSRPSTPILKEAFDKKTPAHFSGEPDNMEVNEKDLTKNSKLRNKGAKTISTPQTPSITNNTKKDSKKEIPSSPTTCSRIPVLLAQETSSPPPQFLPTQSSPISFSSSLRKYRHVPSTNASDKSSEAKATPKNWPMFRKVGPSLRIKPVPTNANCKKGSKGWKITSIKENISSNSSNIETVHENLSKKRKIGEVIDYLNIKQGE